MDIAVWLRSLSLQRYEETFRDNAIEFEILPGLAEPDLEKLGVLLGHRKVMLKAIAALATAPPQTVTEPRGDVAERRQLTVMFSDLVGSTALSSRLDPEDLREVLGAYHACVAEVVTSFGGLVIRHIGDGALIGFGYPQAHEDDAERAVHAGLALVDRIGRLETSSGKLEIRVGIATGLVIVGDLIGNREWQEQDIIGETPYLAISLQGRAAPNAILIAEGTRRLVGELFEYRDLGAAAVRGLAGTAKVWQVFGPSELESRFEALHGARPTPLVGRDKEIDLLLQHWACAKEGNGRIVLLSGEPGIGKSRLTTELPQRLRGEPHLRLRYFCSPHHRESPLHPFTTQLERAAGFAREDGPQAKIEKLEALLSQSGESPTEAAALLADLLALPSGGRYPPLDPDPQRRRELTFAALIRQLDGLARGRPILMIFEDAHWADSTSLELLEMVIERIPRIPVLFLLTFRPEFRPPWAGQAHVTILELARLGRREAATLTQLVAGEKSLPAEILDRIVERADGIPLFIEELTKTLLEGTLVREQDGSYVLDGPLPPLAIPSSLHASLLARLDRLSPVREVAQIAAVLGREFSYEVLAAVVRQSEDQLRDALRLLVEAGLIFRRGNPPHVSFLFKHALVQDAAYDTLLRAQRHQLHAHIGKVFEERFPETVATQPEILAHHYTQAGLVNPAVDYWRKAGERALAHSANAEAVKHLTHGIELVRLLPPSAERDRRELGLLVALGSAMRAAKGHSATETVRVFSRARELLGASTTLREPMFVLNGLWGVHLIRGEHRDARTVAAECFTLARARGVTEALAQASLMVGASRWAMGEFLEAKEYLERVLDLQEIGHERFGSPRFTLDHRVSALSYLAMALWPLGYPRRSVAASMQALDEARGIGHAFTLTFALGARTILSAGLGADWRQATTDADQALTHSIEHGFPLYECWGRFYQGAALVRCGDPRRGVELMRGALASAGKINAGATRTVHLGHLAAAHASLGEPEVGVGLLGEAILAVEQTEERLFEAELHRMRGKMLLASEKKEKQRRRYTGR